MNRERRKLIGQAIKLLVAAQSILETAHEQEDEYLNNMPDAFRYGERGSSVEDGVSVLETAMSETESTALALSELIGEG